MCDCHCHHHHHPDHNHDHGCHNKKSVIIKNPKSGLVLDGSQYELKLQHLTGNPTQLWTLESTDHGTFFIINKGNGKVLDIQGGAENRANLITYNKHGGTNQQWHINSDRTIVSAAGNLAVDIYEGKYHAGNRIIAFKTHGNDNQQFHLQHHH